MKNIIASLLTLSTMALVPMLNKAFAGDPTKVYELAESGITVEFPMTAAEIAAEDAKKVRLPALKEANQNKPQKRVRVIEMGESGQAVSFAMTAAEIAAEDAEQARLAALRKANSNRPQKRVIVFELAESGHVIQFPVQSDSDAAVAEADLSTDSDSRSWALAARGGIMHKK